MVVKVRLGKMHKGSKLSTEHKEAIITSYNDELREVRRQAMLKRYSNPEEKKKQSQRMKLVLGSPEVRARMSEGQGNREHHPAQWENMHKIQV